jgi:hypothetical protein
MSRLIAPRHNYVLLKKVTEVVTSSGLVLPADTAINEFEVINAPENLIGLIGEYVVLNPNAMIVEIDGQYIVSNDDIIAVIQ